MAVTYLATSQAFFSIQMASFFHFRINSSSVRSSKDMKYSHFKAIPFTRASDPIRIDALICSLSLVLRRVPWNLVISIKHALMIVFMQFQHL